MEDCYFSHASQKPLGKMRRASEGEPETGNKRQHRDERTSYTERNENKSKYKRDVFGTQTCEADGKHKETTKQQ